MTEFTVTIDCSAGGATHKHVLVVRADEGVHGSSPPQPVRLQYRCPVAASDHKARFTPPIGAARPFAVVEVR